MGWLGTTILGNPFMDIYPERAPWRLEYLLAFGLNLVVNAGKYSIPAEHMDTDIYRKGFLNHAEGFNNFLVMLQGGLFIQKPDVFRHGAHMNPKNNTTPLKMNSWNLKITQSKRKTIFQISMFGFHVNFQGSYLDL